MQPNLINFKNFEKQAVESEKIQTKYFEKQTVGSDRIQSETVIDNKKSNKIKTFRKNQQPILFKFRQNILKQAV